MASIFTTTLFTSRLKLRPYQLNDAKEISNRLRDKDVAATTLMLPFPCTSKDARDMIKKYKKEEKLQKIMRWAITSISDNQFFGGIRLTPNLQFNSAEIGFWIGKEYWRKGFTFEASSRVIGFGFEELALNRIEAHAMFENRSSINLLKKLGFKQEGYHPELVKKWGEYKDVSTFGLLRKDYSK